MERKDILRRKIISRFIESVEEITENQGGEELNIRNIAEGAGYKTSTL